MDIKRVMNGTQLTVSVNGRVDTTTAPVLEEGVKPYLDGADSLILDFSGVSYVSSAGLRVLLSLQKTMSRRGGMKVTGVCDVVYEIFEVTGFSEILTCERS